MKHLYLLLAAAPLILGSCATQPKATVTGTSMAAEQLLRDTTQLVLSTDVAARPQLKGNRNISIALVNGTKTSVIERWRVECRGAMKSYRVIFTPTPSKGGTDVTVKAEK